MLHRQGRRLSSWLWGAHCAWTLIAAGTLLAHDRATWFRYTVLSPVAVRTVPAQSLINRKMTKRWGCRNNDNMRPLRPPKDGVGGMPNMQ